MRLIPDWLRHTRSYLRYSNVMCRGRRSLNRAGMISTAIESVLAQNDPSVEHIIVDGASSDGTAEVLARYGHLRVVSEPDGGVYEALNKGIALARGEIIGQLNSDDFYEPETFGRVIELFRERPEIDAVSAGANVLENDVRRGDARSRRTRPSVNTI